jgi:AcrR family transcriptional regulator
MSATADTPSHSRHYDAAASRAALLEAARALFGEQGYAQATLREIGARAGVDPALVARYFGSKEELHRAAICADDAAAAPVTGAASEILLRVLRKLLDRTERAGAGPLLQSLVDPAAESSTRGIACARLEEQLVQPLTERFAAEGDPQPRLRAELAVASVIGVVLTRAGGSLTMLSHASAEEIVELLWGQADVQPAGS